MQGSPTMDILEPVFLDCILTHLTYGIRMGPELLFLKVKEIKPVCVFQMLATLVSKPNYFDIMGPIIGLSFMGNKIVKTPT